MLQEIIDPNHDVALHVGGVDLLVSSKILSLVSPTFEAMFKPHFREGSEHHSQQGQKHSIPLSEDDLDAVRLFCQVTHFRYRSIPEKPSPQCLENLAVFWNKYFCAEAMLSCGILWLQKHSDCKSLEDLSCLLLFAYVLDLTEVFTIISSEMLRLQAGPFCTLWALDNDLFDADLLSLCNEQKSALDRRLSTAFMELTYRIAEFKCDEAHKFNGQYLHYLRKCKIFPRENSFDEQSVSTIIERASGSDSCHFTACSIKRCNCYQIRGMDLKEELQKGIQECLKVEPDFCIRCIKGETSEKGRGKCLHMI